MIVDNRFLATLTQRIAKAMLEDNSISFHEALRRCLSPHVVVTHFMHNGYDGALVTDDALRACATLTWPLSKPLRSLADMLECIKQRQLDVLSDEELILALKCTPHQLETLKALY